MESIFGAILVIALAITAATGAIRTFRRSFWLAALLLVFLFPVWLLWAFVEMFRGPTANNAVNEKHSGKPTGHEQPVIASPARIVSARTEAKSVAQPIVIPRVTTDRVDSVQHLGGKKWRVFVTYWYNDSVGYSNYNREISPGVSGFNVGSSNFDVRWIG